MATEARKVGIRELKSHLSSIVAEARRGQRFAVTDHGHIVAELGPVQAARVAGADVATRLVAGGGTAAVQPFDLQMPAKTADWRAVDVVALIDELRGA